jgi:DNA mismatch repair protein MSH2
MAEAVDSPDGQKLAHIAERSRMLVSPRKKSSFTTKDINQDLDRLLALPEGTNAAALPETEMVHAMAAAASLIDYLEILRDDGNFGKYTLERFDGSQ